MFCQHVKQAKKVAEERDDLVQSVSTSLVSPLPGVDSDI